MTALSILPLAGIAAFFFLLLVLHEFRVHARIKAASARLERGSKRGGYVPLGHRRLGE